jgi:hypothetical protein
LKDVASAADVKAHPAGYLLVAEEEEDDSTTNTIRSSSASPPPLERQAVVVVCGLAHVNGVVERLSARAE